MHTSPKITASIIKTDYLRYSLLELKERKELNSPLWILVNCEASVQWLERLQTKHEISEMKKQS